MKQSWPWSGVLGKLVNVRGSEQQLAQYLAVRAGIRRVLDDWIPVAQFSEYERTMRHLGMVVAPECLFQPLDVHVAGAEIVPTTRAVGQPFRRGQHTPPGSTVHVMVSSRADWVADAHAVGWYSVVVGDRCVRKPLIDHARLGRAFGYPDCCVEFFLRHNDWPRMSTVADAAAHTERFCWETNCFPRHTPWMALFHMPCRFDCSPTREYVRAVLAEVRAEDSNYAIQIERTMRLPYLFVNEVMCYALHGGSSLGPSHARYDAAIPISGRPSDDLWGLGLARGDELEISDGSVFVLKQGRTVHTLEGRCDRGRIDVPVLLPFDRT